MDRNFLLAFLLSTIAIFTYYTLYPPQPPQVVEEPAVVEAPETPAEPATISPAKIAENSSSEIAAVESNPVQRKMVDIESGLYSIKINSVDGALQQFMLKDYGYSMEPRFSITNFVLSLFTGNEEEEEVYDPERLVNMAGDPSEGNVIWKLSTGPDNTPVNYHVPTEKMVVDAKPEILTMKAMLPSGLEAEKSLTFYPDSYVIDMDVRILNRTGRDQTINPNINFGVGGEAIKGEALPQPRMAVSFIDEEFEKYDGGDAEDRVSVDNARWAGLANKYFIHVIQTNDKSVFKGELNTFGARFNGDTINIPQLLYTDDPLRLANNQEYNRKFKLYVGPKVESFLSDFDYYLPQAMDLGWFEFLARPLLSVLRWLQSYVVNWGIAIILLTIIVRTAMFPLAFKSMTSMRKMQALTPKITTIREKYKNDKDKMNQEIMQFYSQNKVNPMGGCLPLLLQFPIFIALYQALLPAIELRHTPFVLFWSDLSAADYTLILPVLMGLSMYVQQSMTPTPTMDPTQAKIMKWMPVMMVLFFLNMPSGLVLYWVVSNIISVGQQVVFNKIAPAPAAPVAEKGGKKGKAVDKKGKVKKGKGK